MRTRYPRRRRSAWRTAQRGCRPDSASVRLGFASVQLLGWQIAELECLIQESLHLVVEFDWPGAAAGNPATGSSGSDSGSFGVPSSFDPGLGARAAATAARPDGSMMAIVITATPTAPVAIKRLSTLITSASGPNTASRSGCPAPTRGDSGTQESPLTDRC